MVEQGKVIFVSQIQSGLNPKTNNKWSLQNFVIETNERFPRKIAFTLFGEDKISAAGLRMGELIDVTAYAESHEYNGTWYTELRCTDICQNRISRFVQTQMFSTTQPPTTPPAGSDQH